jgi:hypothetical protein
MTTSQLEKLLFSQGGKCFFCKNKLERSDASVEHLLAKANGGSNNINENCVACCKSVNSLFGSLSLKNKIDIILNQEGKFLCPAGEPTKNKLPAKQKSSPKAKVEEKTNTVLTNLIKRGNAKPKRFKTLVSTIGSIAELKGIKEQEVLNIIQLLEKQGKITVKEEKVVYSL